MAMRQREFVEYDRTGGGELHDHPAPVCIIFAARDCAESLQPVHQFDSAVVFQTQPLSQFADSCVFPLRKPANCQQQLMLLRLKTK